MVSFPPPLVHSRPGTPSAAGFERRHFFPSFVWVRGGKEKKGKRRRRKETSTEANKVRAARGTISRDNKSASFSDLR